MDKSALVARLRSLLLELWSVTISSIIPRRRARMDRITLRAKQVLLSASHEASDQQASVITAAHLISGMMQDDGSIAYHVLTTLGFKAPNKAEVQSTPSDPPDGEENPTVSEPTLSEGTKRVLELAVDEARRMGNHFIGTEHLLLGVARYNDLDGAELKGLTLPATHAIRNQVKKAVSASKSQHPLARRR